MLIEARLRALGLDLPMQTADQHDYYGQKYGKMKPYYRAGNILFLSGHTAGMPECATAPRCTLVFSGATYRSRTATGRSLVVGHAGSVHPQASM